MNDQAPRQLFSTEGDGNAWVRLAGGSWERCVLVVGDHGLVMHLGAAGPLRIRGSSVVNVDELGEPGGTWRIIELMLGSRRRLALKLEDELLEQLLTMLRSTTRHPGAGQRSVRSHTPPRGDTRWRAPLEAVAILAGAGVLFWIGSVILDNATGPPVQPARSRVEYCWSGTARSVNLTLSNASGGTEQIDGLANNQCRALGSLAPGSFLYVSVQNADDSGSVECAVKVDGITAKDASSAGAYVIATCSGRL